MIARLSTTAAALLIALAVPAMAQTSANPSGGSTVQTTPRPQAAPVREDDDSGNWGWLGLLGLAGLAPLFMKKKDAVADTTTTRRTL